MGSFYDVYTLKQVEGRWPSLPSSLISWFDGSEGQSGRLHIASYFPLHFLFSLHQTLSSNIQTKPNNQPTNLIHYGDH